MERHIASLSRRIGWLVLGTAGWTAFVWGTRLVLLESGAGGAARSRIGVSYAFAAALLWIGLRFLRQRASLPHLSGWVLLAFGAWMAVTWIPEVVELAAAADHSPVFRLVHISLALVSLGLGTIAADYGRRLIRGLIPIGVAPARPVG